MPQHSTNAECLEGCSSRFQAVTHVDTHTVLYLLRKPVFAAVINNLEVSPSMQSFKSSQLAAWLSPLRSQSVIRATCRPPIIVLPSDRPSLLVFVMPNFCCRTISCSCSLSSWCFYPCHELKSSIFPLLLLVAAPEIAQLHSIFPFKSVESLVFLFCFLSIF